MSYELAVWEGERPEDDDAAGQQWMSLAEHYLETEDANPPTERIREYVGALLRRWPDITIDETGESPWSVGPLLGEADGPVICVSMQWDRAEEVSAFVAKTAASMGLVCFDLQTDTLRS